MINIIKLIIYHGWWSLFVCYNLIHWVESKFMKTMWSMKEEMKMKNAYEYLWLVIEGKGWSIMTSLVLMHK